MKNKKIKIILLVAFFLIASSIVAYIIYRNLHPKIAILPCNDDESYCYREVVTRVKYEDTNKYDKTDIDQYLGEYINKDNKFIVNKFLMNTNDETSNIINAYMDKLYDTQVKYYQVMMNELKDKDSETYYHFYSVIIKESDNYMSVIVKDNYGGIMMSGEETYIKAFVINKKDNKIVSEKELLNNEDKKEVVKRLNKEGKYDMYSEDSAIYMDENDNVVICSTDFSSVLYKYLKED